MEHDKQWIAVLFGCLRCATIYRAIQFRGQNEIQGTFTCSACGAVVGAWSGMYGLRDWKAVNVSDEYGPKRGESRGARKARPKPKQRGVTSKKALQTVKAKGTYSTFGGRRFYGGSHRSYQIAGGAGVYLIENAKLYGDQQCLIEAQRRFVPSEFLESLHRPDIARVQPGEYVAKTMSILFADLRNFTPLAERLDPRTVIELLNGFFVIMEPEISRMGGFIDSFRRRSYQGAVRRSRGCSRACRHRDVACA